MTNEIVKRHFHSKTLSALKNKGIIVMSTTTIPDTKGGFANGQTGYNVDDNGTGRVYTFLEVLERAEDGN